MKAPALLMFDLDGTLIDSKRDIADQVNAALVERGLPAAPYEEIGRWIGRGSHYLFGKLTGERLPAPRIDELVAAFQRLYAEHLCDTTTLYPGAIDVLERFSAVPKVIVSNKSQVFCDPLVERLALRPHFQAVYGAEAFAARKPDPLPLREACRLAGVEPARAVFIGDSWADVAASKACGCVTVAALYGYGDLAAMRQLEPEHEIARLSDLIALVG